MKTKPHVIVIGGGFGGLRTVQKLANVPVDITLIDRSNHHLFQPLLYQVATAGLSAEEIAVPIRAVLRRQKNVRVLLNTVTAANLDAQTVQLEDGTGLSYDYLVVAAGAQTNYYAHPEWQPFTIGVKDLQDAVELRRRILTAFEAAELSDDPAEQRRLLTFCVIGGGPTGVELAGAISELARAVLARDFRAIKADAVRVVLIEMGPRLLTAFTPELSQYTADELTKMGVEVRLNTSVVNISAQGVELKEASIDAAVVCWTAGVQPRPLAKQLGVPCNKNGGITINDDCSIGAYANAFAMGDIATFVPYGAARPLPGIAPVAMQQANHVASMICGDLRQRPRRPFHYTDKGNMATIGRLRAVLQFGRLRMTGLMAWLAWLLVHIYYTIGFRNRALVMFEWLGAYLFKRHGARIIPQVQPPVGGLSGNLTPSPLLRRNRRRDSPQRNLQQRWDVGAWPPPRH